MDAREFRISSGLPRAVVRQSLLRAVVMALIAVPAGLWMGNFSTDSPPVVIVGALLVVVVALAGGVYLGLRRQTAQWKTFRITLSDASIRRRIGGLADLIIGKHEVIEIQELSGHGLMIVTKDHHRRVFVPDVIDNYPELRTELATWLPPVAKKPVGMQTLVYAATIIATVALILASSKSTDTRVVVPASAALVLVLGGSLMYVWRSPHVTRSVRLYCLLLLPMILVYVHRIWTFTR